MQVTRELYQREQQDTDAHSSHSGAISSSVHDLSPTLWHALDVWRCTNSLSGGFREALKALAHCGLGLASETWWVLWVMVVVGGGCYGWWVFWIVVGRGEGI